SASRAASFQPGDIQLRAQPQPQDAIECPRSDRRTSQEPTAERQPKTTDRPSVAGSGDGIHAATNRLPLSRDFSSPGMAAMEFANWTTRWRTKIRRWWRP